MFYILYLDAKMVKLAADEAWGASFDEQLKFYLSKYLTFLRMAGNHVLFDLPDFAVEDQHRSTDYARLSTHVELDKYCSDVTVFNIPSKTINEFLERRWADAISFAQKDEDDLKACVAEISTNWFTGTPTDSHFYIRFGAPHIKPLCPYEVVLFFEVKDIAFFRSSDFEKLVCLPTSPLL